MSYKEVSGGICAPRGFAAAGVHCGIRANHNEKYDLALIKAEVRCAAAGVYTTNKVCGAPIKVDRAHLKDGYAQAILVNSGNANTCAANGVALAEECCALVGKALDIPAEDVLPFAQVVEQRNEHHLVACCVHSQVQLHPVAAGEGGWRVNARRGMAGEPQARLRGLIGGRTICLTRKYRAASARPEDLQRPVSI